MTEIVVPDPSTALTLSLLRAELAARGFDYETDARLNRWINRAYQETCEEEDWPFLEASGTGTAPLVIQNLRTIMSVIDSTTLTKLSPVDPRNITDVDTDSTRTGSPIFYYVGKSADSDVGGTVNVYPLNTTDTIAVTYISFPGDMTADADEPLLPNRHRLLIADGATGYAYLDSDNPEMAQQMFSLWEAGKERMRNAMLSRQHDQPDDYIIQSYDEAW